MSDLIVRCPHCGQSLNLPVEPGIIRASEDAELADPFSLITVEDLHGKTAEQRRALVYLRFKNSRKFKDGIGAFDDADGYMFADWEKHLPSLQEAEVEVGPVDQLERDLAAVQPYLDNIIKDGRFVYGYQSRIAEALAIPNEGSYRRRIKNVAAALARQLPAPQEDSTSTTAKAVPDEGQAKQRAA